MRQYRLWHSLVCSFYSKTFYRDVGYYWRGAGLTYLFLLAFLFSIPFLYWAQVNRGLFIQTMQPLVAQLPAITLQQGTISIDKPSPFFIKAPDSDKVVGIIDTSGQSTSLDKSPATFLLTQNKLYVREGNNTIKVYSDLSYLHEGSYSPATIKKFLQSISLFVLMFVYFFVLFLTFFISIIIVLVFAGVAKALTHTRLSYKTLCRLAATALTPAFILGILLSVLKIHLPYLWLVYIPISIGYLLYAIEANKEQIPLSE